MAEKIDIYIDGRSFANQGSGFSVILTSMNNKWLRSFAYGKYSVNQADLLALKFALLSINEKSRSHDITIYTKNNYIIDMFSKENNEYKQIPSSNVDMIDEIKTLMTKNITFEKSGSSDLFEICKNMTIDAIKDGKLVDIKK